MDMTVQLSRTIRGQEEIFNHGHTVRPKCRQILFAIGNGITFGALRDKLSNPELETLLNDLQRGGFIEAEGGAPVAQPAPAPISEAAAPAAVSAAPAPAASPAASGLEAGRDYVLKVISVLAGTKSPAYRKMSGVSDMEGFNEALPGCRKMIAAVASPHQAAEMEAEALKRVAG